MAAGAIPSENRAVAARWRDLWRRWGVTTETGHAIDALVSHYRAPGRHYHTLAHVAHCLRELDAASDLAERPEAVEAALWFHDVVYDPQRHDNEARSVDFAAGVMRSFGIAEADVALVRDLVLATRHDSVPTTQDACLVVDIDLAILAAPPGEFAVYERAIRREYAHVPEPAFRAGRAAILRAFLAREWIYATPRFRDRYELQARRNLTSSLAALEEPA